ncbi:MAG: PIG-L family deacetylase [Acidobacteriota bacterium]
MIDRPEFQRYEAIYLSPHLDDVVLSCGGRMHRRAARGENVLAVTVFTGDVPDGPLSELAATVLMHMGLSREEASERRRQEDLAACELLGAEAIHWPYDDATYRRDEAGEPSYTTARELFAGTPTAADTDLEDELVEAFGQLPPADLIAAPLGVGGHVDHLLVRRAAERVFGQKVAFYEDFPYVRKLFALRRTVGDRRQWHSVPEPLDPSDLVAKVRAVAAYTSQVPPLFGDERRMERQIRRRAKRVGGERLWYRKLD